MKLVYRGSLDETIEQGEPLFRGDLVYVKDGKAYKIPPGGRWMGDVWCGFGVYNIKDEPHWDISSR